MKIILMLEYVAVFFLATYGFYITGESWWWYFGLFFLPDISMLGYLLSTKIGAFLYNFFHHYGTAIFLWFIGLYFQTVTLQMLACILLAHTSFDRIWGYGLKYEDNFQNTHLGKIGRSKEKE